MARPSPSASQDGSEIVPGYRAYMLKGKDEDGNEYHRPILLNRRIALGGSDIANAVPSPQQTDAVAITLNGDGTDKMIALTKNMRPDMDRIAIVLDGEVISAPVVNQVPLGKQFIIEGLREPGEVQRLANALMNPLENPLVVEEDAQRLPHPRRRRGQARASWPASLGLGLTCLFMLVYYRFSGMIAADRPHDQRRDPLRRDGDVRLHLLAARHRRHDPDHRHGGGCQRAHLRTPARGNRRRQIPQKRHRRRLRKGLQRDFRLQHHLADHRASSSSALGSGTIKGFAITLTIGLTASMFSAILVTRVLFRWGMDFKLIKKLSFLNLIKADELRLHRQAPHLRHDLGRHDPRLHSSAFGVRGERALGIDFTGGTRIMFQLGEDAKIPLGEVNKALARLKLTKAAYPQEESNPATGTLLTVRCATPDAAPSPTKCVKPSPCSGEKNAGIATITSSTPAREEVSAVIGGTFMTQSIIAIVCGLIGIMLYMTARFEFSFALGGFVAILHDIIISVGIIVLMGGELSLIHVGAVLTIAGYSINDTIIVFDRIRETVLIRTGSIEKIMNEAINATLSRTLITSGATLIQVAILAFLGGSALRDFGMIIFIGIIVGTFSSIFIASPIVLWWSNAQGPQRPRGSAGLRRQGGIHGLRALIRATDGEAARPAMPGGGEGPGWFNRSRATRNSFGGRRLRALRLARERAAESPWR